MYIVFKQHFLDIVMEENLGVNGVAVVVWTNAGLMGWIYANHKAEVDHSGLDGFSNTFEPSVVASVEPNILVCGKHADSLSNVSL